MFWVFGSSKKDAKHEGKAMEHPVKQKKTWQWSRYHDQMHIIIPTIGNFRVVRARYASSIGAVTSPKSRYGRDQNRPGDPCTVSRRCISGNWKAVHHSCLNQRGSQHQKYCQAEKHQALRVTYTNHGRVLRCTAHVCKSFFFIHALMVSTVNGARDWQDEVEKTTRCCNTH